MSGIGECGFTCVAKDAEHDGGRIFSPCHATAERGVQRSHKLGLIPCIDMLSHQGVQHVRRSTHCRAVAADVGQSDARQNRMTTYREVMDVAAAVACSN